MGAGEYNIHKKGNSKMKRIKLKTLIITLIIGIIILIGLGIFACKVQAQVRVEAPKQFTVSYKIPLNSSDKVVEKLRSTVTEYKIVSYILVPHIVQEYFTTHTSHEVPIQRTMWYDLIIVVERKN